MDIESLIPLLFAAIYIISRIMKARQKKETPGRPVRPQQSAPNTSSSAPPQRKTFSFEDILKEFEKNLAGEEEEEKPLPVEETRYEKPKPAPVVKKPEPTIYQSYEGTTYESLAGFGKEPKESGRNKNYALKENIISNYVKMLQDPEGAKNAIILSEIINRKYF
jgi:hypothetical protein